MTSPTGQPAAANATVTVELDGRAVTFELDGTELAMSVSPDGSDGRPYLSNASRGFIADKVEASLIALVELAATSGL